MPQRITLTILTMNLRVNFITLQTDQFMSCKLSQLSQTSAAALQCEGLHCYKPVDPLSMVEFGLTQEQVEEVNLAE